MKRMVIDIQSLQCVTLDSGVGKIALNYTIDIIKKFSCKFEIFLVINGRLECENVFDNFFDVVDRKHIKTWRYYPELIPMELRSNKHIYPIEFFYDWFINQFNADVVWYIEVGSKDPTDYEVRVTNDNNQYSVVMSTIFDVSKIFEVRSAINNPNYDGWRLRKMEYINRNDIILMTSNREKQILEENTPGLTNQTRVLLTSDSDWLVIVDELIKKKKINLSYRKVDSYIKLCRSVTSLFENCDYESKALFAKSIQESTMFRKTLHIYIDTSSLVEQTYVTGIQRFINGNILNIQQLFNGRDNIEVIPVYSTNSDDVFYKARFNGIKYTKNVKPGPDDIVDFYDGDILIMPDLNPGFVVAKQEFLEQLCNRGIRVITILHDILQLQYPQYFFDMKNYNFFLVKDFVEYLKIIPKLTSIVGMSGATMNAYYNWCDYNRVELPARLIKDYNYPGADFQNVNASSGIPDENLVLRKQMNKYPTILMVSTIEPRKGYDVVLPAMEELWKQGKKINLVFVGRPGWMMDGFIEKMKTHPQKDKLFFWLNGISDEYLSKVYQSCTGVIVASRGEGYGLSTIEAAQYKKPILVRDIDIFREIAGENAAYFTDDSPEVLAETIDRWLESIEDGIAPDSAKIKYNTWEESARNLINIIDPTLLNDNIERKK